VIKVIRTLIIILFVHIWPTRLHAQSLNIYKTYHCFKTTVACLQNNEHEYITCEMMIKLRYTLSIALSTLWSSDYMNNQFSIFNNKIPIKMDKTEL